MGAKQGLQSLNRIYNYQHDTFFLYKIQRDNICISKKMGELIW